ncbi:MAG: hypothetical protein CSA47_01130 [Gammaproteobacteria bacterium]|nr:MAG: hypothetical protein CSA47_01130 [Gammaproteobacteria bacterium]
MNLRWLQSLNPRRSLLTRIFLTFWATLIFMLLVIGFVLTMAQGEAPKRHKAKQLRELQQLRAKIITDLRAGESDAVVALLNNTPAYLRDQFRVYDDLGFELLDRYDEEQSSFFRPALEIKAPIFYDKINDVFGTTYEIFVRLRPRLTIFESRHPSGIFIRLLLALLISFVGCYLLARSLTRPIHRLQRRARKVIEVNRIGTTPVTLPDIRYGADELGQLGRDIDDMTRQLQDNINQKQQLLRDIAHDFRAPLFRQRIALDMLRSEKSAKFEVLKKQLIHDHEQLTQLAEQTLSWLRHGDDELVLEPIDLHQLCREIIQDAQFEFATVQFSLYSDKQMLFYSGDRHLLGSAVENIVRNAGKFARSQVSVTVGQDRQYVHIIVKDDGDGVPEGDLARIVEPFVQVDDARTPSAKKGAGLGLTIAKQALQRHGGKLTASNRQGLVVTIQLPIGT